MEKLTIITPASTANMGPGFDTVGIAIELYNTLNAQWSQLRSIETSKKELVDLIKAGTELTIKGEGEGKLNKNNLDLFFNSLGEMLLLADGRYLYPEELSLNFNNSIPLARGLGSSAACIISALTLGREMLNKRGVKINQEDIIKKAIKIEGHADNVLPAFLGGALLSILKDDGRPLILPLTIDRELKFIFAIPDLEISSKEAREILPQKVFLKKAIENSALLGALIIALEKKEYNHLRELMQSPLHIPYRSQLIPDYSQVEEAAYNHGALGFTISGAGSTLLALAKDNCRAIGLAMVEVFRANGYRAEYFISSIEEKGVQIKR